MEALKFAFVGNFNIYLVKEKGNILTEGAVIPPKYCYKRPFVTYEHSHRTPFFKNLRNYYIENLNFFNISVKYTINSSFYEIRSCEILTQISTNIHKHKHYG